MEQVGQAIRAHHRELSDTLKTQAEALADGRTNANPQALVEFLEKDLLPHARGEEKSLYPVVDELVRDHSKATATMNIDHEIIGKYVRQIKETAQSLNTAPDVERPALRRGLGRLALKLDALFELHLQKEERVYLPLMEKYLSAEEQQNVLREMHEG